jgi:2'-5' RNA ligase
MSTRKGYHMYYIALVCPNEIDEVINRFKLWMRDSFGCKAAMKSPAHITLVAPFWLADEKENELREGLKSFSPALDKLDVNLDGFSHFNRKTIYVQVESNPGLNELKRDAENYFFGLFPREVKNDDHPFQPHITIANRDLKPGDFEQAWNYFSTLSYTATFQVRAISLLEHLEGKWHVVGESIPFGPLKV